MALSGFRGSGRSLLLGLCASAFRLGFAALLLVSLALTFSGFLGTYDDFSHRTGRRLLESPSTAVGSVGPSQGGSKVAEAATVSPSAAAGRAVADLRLRGLRHRLMRMSDGEETMLEDDRDAARIQTMLGAAEAVAQRQQFERAIRIFRKATTDAKEFVASLRQGGAVQAELDNAQHLLGEAFLRSGKFYLERGLLKPAQNLIEKAAPVFAGRSDIAAWQSRLLEANVKRDAADAEHSDDMLMADVLYDALIAQLTTAALSTSSSDQAALHALASEARGEYARAKLIVGRATDARLLSEEALGQPWRSGQPSEQTLPMTLAVRLKGWLGLAHLAEGDAKKALPLLDISLAGLGSANLPSGLSAATAEVQEVMLGRVRAKAALGDVRGANEDLEVIQALQEELRVTIKDHHNPKFSKGSGRVPDPRLWAAMARTKTVAAELKLQTTAATPTISAESLASATRSAHKFAEEALHLLREVKNGGCDIPRGLGLASFDEVRALMKRVRSYEGNTGADESVPSKKSSAASSPSAVSKSKDDKLSGQDTDQDVEEEDGPADDVSEWNDEIQNVEEGEWSDPVQSDGTQLDPQDEVQSESGDSMPGSDMDQTLDDVQDRLVEAMNGPQTSEMDQMMEAARAAESSTNELEDRIRKMAELLGRDQPDESVVKTVKSEDQADETIDKPADSTAPDNTQDAQKQLEDVVNLMQEKPASVV